MRPSSQDSLLASEASALLAERGRENLTVTDEQVLRWRQADLLPVLSDRLGGRGRATAYASSAAEVAAALAVELASDRNLDRAALAAFVPKPLGGGANVAEKGLRAAYFHYLTSGAAVAAKLRRAAKEKQLVPGEGWVDVAKRRSDVPWRQRLPFPSSRQAGTEEVPDTVLGMLLGDFSGSDGTDLVDQSRMRLALDGVAGVGDMLDDPPEEADGGEEVPRSVADIIRWFTMAGLRSTAATASYDDLRWGCWVAASLVEFLRQAKRYADLTGADLSLLGPVGRAIRLQSWLPKAQRETMLRGASVAVIGAGMVMFASRWPYMRRAAERVARECEDNLPKVEAAAALTLSLPEHWRPAAAPFTGPAYLANMDATEREHLVSTVRAWMAEHPSLAGAMGALPVAQ